jgi:ribulose-phosphate 3-epimerase
MGSVVVKGLRPVTTLPLEVHLMVEDPARFIDGFVQAGADAIIAHHEVLDDPMPLVRDVKARGKKVGLAINPETPVTVLTPFLGEIDLALCMTVHPGFGGQPFIEESIDRIRELRRLIALHNPNCELEVDGGIDRETAAATVRAGANVLVAGTSIFRAKEGAADAVRLMTVIG